MTYSKTLKTWFEIIGITACITFAILIFEAHQTMRSSQQFLGSMRSLVPGASTLADVKAIQGQFPKYARQSDRCNAGHCTVTFTFESWYSHFVRPAGLQVDVTVHNGTVSSIGMLSPGANSVFAVHNATGTVMNPRHLGFLI